MNLIFRNPGIEYMLRSIMAFQSDDESPFWSESLYRFYPQLDKEYAGKLEFAERKAYIEATLKTVYEELEDTIDQKAIEYTRHWETYKKQIEEALSEAFDIDCTALFNDLRCDISMNPVSPRFLKGESFEVFYLNSERGALGTSLHEIIHFVWFYVWNRLFGDSYEEYERPDLKWILSEMVVEPIMKDERLSSINPYFPREQGGCIYPYFFDMKVENKLVLDVLDEMYQSMKVTDFMKASYAFCKEHEREIRKHIEAAEGAWTMDF